MESDSNFKESLESEDALSPPGARLFTDDRPTEDPIDPVLSPSEDSAMAGDETPLKNVTPLETAHEVGDEPAADNPRSGDGSPHVRNVARIHKADTDKETESAGVGTACADLKLEVGAEPCSDNVALLNTQIVPQEVEEECASWEGKGLDDLAESETPFEAGTRAVTQEIAQQGPPTPDEVAAGDATTLNKTWVEEQVGHGGGCQEPVHFETGPGGTGVDLVGTCKEGSGATRTGPGSGNAVVEGGVKTAASEIETPSKGPHMRLNQETSVEGIGPMTDLGVAYLDDFMREQTLPTTPEGVAAGAEISAEGLGTGDSEGADGGEFSPSTDPPGPSAPTSSAQSERSEEEMPRSAAFRVGSFSRSGSSQGMLPTRGSMDPADLQRRLSRKELAESGSCSTRQIVETVHLEALDEEHRLMHQMQQMGASLDAGRTACEAMSKLLRGMASAEGLYARACANMSKSAVLTGSGDGSNTLFAACEAIGVLPRAAAGAHLAAEQKLSAAAGDASSCASSAASEMKALTVGAAEKQKQLQRARAALMAALVTLERYTERQKEPPSGARRVSDSIGIGAREDTWLAESRLAEAHQALFRSQEGARAMYANALQRVHQVQQQRQETLKLVLGTCVGTYQKLLAGLDESVSGVAGVLEAAQQGSSDSQHGMEESTTDVQETFARVRDRQCTALEARTSALFNSPSIIRQGRLVMHGLKPGAEPQEHNFVLTQCGYLHWYSPKDDIVPSAGLKLSRCTIEATEPCVFTIAEVGEHGAKQSFLVARFSRSRRLTLQAPSAEECTEWVLSVKEAIVEHGGVTAH